MFTFKITEYRFKRTENLWEKLWGTFWLSLLTTALDHTKGFRRDTCILEVKFPGLRFISLWRPLGPLPLLLSWMTFLSKIGVYDI